MRRFIVGAILALCALPSFAATAFITEFKGAGWLGVTVYFQAANAPALANQTVAVGGGSLQSAAFGANTGLVRIHVDVATCVNIGGTNPTATTSSMRLAAGQTEYFVVLPGDKVAVIAAP